MSPLSPMKALVLAACLPGAALAATPAADLQQLRAEIEQIRRSHQAQIQALEARLQRAEAASRAPVPAPAPAPLAAAPLPPAPVPQAMTPVAVPPSRQVAAAAAGDRFNPQIELILSGQLARLSRVPTGRIEGYALPVDADPLRRGFSLGESELRLSASVDPRFYGAMALAVHGDNQLSVEEAFVETTALTNGKTVKAGRFYSGIGYLNPQHAHAWDFIDNPLAYQAFLGTQFSQDGVQARWLLPTERYVSLFAEAGNGVRFPGAAADRNRAGALALGVKSGSDWGTSSSWQAGASVLRTDPRGRESLATDRSGSEVRNAYSGRSTAVILDGVWKWAPNGDATRTSFQLQGEYIRRREDGTLTYDSAATASADRYAATQSGWYVQGVYRVTPTWRAGLRYDRLDAGRVDFGANAANLAASDFRPRRMSALVEWRASEFSRVRLQLADDRSRIEGPDRQLLLQYQMSLGAHGAHGY